MKNNKIFLALNCVGLVLATQANSVTFNFQEGVNTEHGYWTRKDLY